MKIFGIGLNKTGTTSLSLAFEQLGLRHCKRRPNLLKLYFAGEFQAIFDHIENFDSFEDWPWPLMVPQLLDHYGEHAKFILTRRRSPEAWLESIKAHALRTHPQRNPRAQIFGAAYPQENEELYCKKYEAHLSETRALFATNNRQSQFLELCFEEGDGWSDLCSFLDKPQMTGAFPKVNVSSAMEINSDRLAENLEGIAAQRRSTSKL